jgi:hypothetical protein
MCWAGGLRFRPEPLPVQASNSNETAAWGRQDAPATTPAPTTVTATRPTPTPQPAESPQAIGAFESRQSRNLFAELLGKSDAEIQQKRDRYVSQFALDGKPLSGERSSGLIAMNAVASLAADPDKSKDFVQALCDLGIPRGQDATTMVCCNFWRCSRSAATIVSTLRRVA